MPSPLAGYEFPPLDVSWETRDILLFAISIGCTMDELQFLYEDHPRFSVFPTYAVTVPFKVKDQVSEFFTTGTLPDGVPTFDYSRLVDGQRKVTFFLPLPFTSEGRKFQVRTKVVAVLDKGKAGTVVESEQLLVENETVYSRMIWRVFFVGQGNWGGPIDNGSVKALPPPTREPDAVHVNHTTLTTAHLYRLNGDYNPLHATPEPGRKLGFGGIILHGMYTYNSTAHGLLKTIGGSDGRNLKEFEARFALPVKPGEILTTKIWRSGNTERGFEEVSFVVENDQHKTVLSNGRALIRIILGDEKL